MTGIRIDKLLRSRRRSIALEITREARLVVRAPYFVSQSDIERLILDRKDWILAKQELFRKAIGENPPKRFIDGETYYFLGKTYTLRIIEGKHIRLQDQLEFPARDLHRAREKMIKWYKKQALQVIRERVEHYSRLLGLSYSSVRISNARKRFGSCNSKARLNFSWRLVMAPLEIIDYVVIHELMHLVEMNHSRRFWKRVAEVMPDYKSRRAWLRGEFSGKGELQFEQV